MPLVDCIRFSWLSALILYWYFVAWFLVSENYLYLVLRNVVLYEYRSSFRGFCFGYRVIYGWILSVLIVYVSWFVLNICCLIFGILWTIWVGKPVSCFCRLVTWCSFVWILFSIVNLCWGFTDWCCSVLRFGFVGCGVRISGWFWFLVIKEWLMLHFWTS